MKALHKQFRDLRLSRGLSQRMLARNYGVSEGSIILFEREGKGISVLTLVKILNSMDGSLMILNFSPEIEEEFIPAIVYRKDEKHEESGVTWLQALKAAKQVIDKFPNMFIQDKSPRQSIAGIERYLIGEKNDLGKLIVVKRDLRKYYLECDKRWKVYNEERNGHILRGRPTTNTLEMRILTVAKYLASPKEFYMVPDKASEILGLLK